MQLGRRLMHWYVTTITHHWDRHGYQSERLLRRVNMKTPFLVGAVKYRKKNSSGVSSRTARVEYDYLRVMSWKLPGGGALWYKHYIVLSRRVSHPLLTASFFLSVGVLAGGKVRWCIARPRVKGPSLPMSDGAEKWVITTTVHQCIQVCTCTHTHTHTHTQGILSPGLHVRWFIAAKGTHKHTHTHITCLHMEVEWFITLENTGSNTTFSLCTDQMKHTINARVTRQVCKRGTHNVVCFTWLSDNKYILIGVNQVRHIHHL